MSTSSQFNSDLSNVFPNKKIRTSPVKKYRIFNFCFIMAALVPTIAVGLFNVIIDPYGVFNLTEIYGLNQTKIEKLNNGRLFRAIDVTRIKPVTVFLGSSRNEYGLNPNHPALGAYQPAYNLGIGFANAHELRRYLEHALANQKNMKLVIISIDEFTFNSGNIINPSFDDKRLEQQHLIIPDAINTTLSIDSIKASRDTIIASITNREYKPYTSDGMLNLRSLKLDKSSIDSRFSNSISFYLRAFPRFDLSQQYLNDFKAMIKLCKEHNIAVKVFISPSHAIRWEVLHTAEQWSMYEQMKREVVKIVPVWDFSGYNSITTEPVRENIKNYIDDSHYRKEVGDLVLNRILSYENQKVPDDFGVLLAPTNVASHLAKIRADREDWVKNNPDKVQLVQNIKNQVQTKMLKK